MLLLARKQISSLLSFEDYVGAVEDAFRRHALGETLEPALAHVDAAGGEFHIKAGGLLSDPPYFALKVNGGFFQNRAKHGLPNIQGLIVLSRADNGVPLAAMDSIEITIQRTGAATAVAAKHLARPNSRVCTVCGLGNQGRVQLRGLKHALPLEVVYAWSQTKDEFASFRDAVQSELAVEVLWAEDLGAAVSASDAVVTCTPSRKPFLRRDWVKPGTFIAAVGADSPDKQELDADLTASMLVVADLRAQVIHVGETHHAIVAGLMWADQIHAEIGEIITGKRPGRTYDTETILYDSTGTALQDAAAAAMAYERARAAGVGLEWEPVS